MGNKRSENEGSTQRCRIFLSVIYFFRIGQQLSAYLQGMLWHNGSIKQFSLSCVTQWILKMYNNNSKTLFFTHASLPFLTLSFCCPFLLFWYVFFCLSISLCLAISSSYSHLPVLFIYFCFFFSFSPSFPFCLALSPSCPLFLFSLLYFFGFILSSFCSPLRRLPPPPVFLAIFLFVHNATVSNSVCACRTQTKLFLIFHS